VERKPFHKFILLRLKSSSLFP